MKNSTFFKIAAMTFATLFTAPTMAQQTSESTSTKDTWIRSDNNTVNNNSKATMEIKSYTDESDATKNRYFYGVMAFSVPSDLIGGTVKSATLRLVTERIKGKNSMAIYSVGDYPEQPKYEDLADDIANIGTVEPIVTFNMNGQWNKALGNDAIGDDYRDLSVWTNTIDLTNFIGSLTAANFNILIAATENNNNPACIYTSDATDVTNAKDATLTFAAADLKPLLTITYKAGDGTGIKQVAIEAASKSQSIYNLQGVRVANMSKPGIYIVNGKKVAVK